MKTTCSFISKTAAAVLAIAVFLLSAPAKGGVILEIQSLPARQVLQEYSMFC
jgi:hypothetical protein